MNVNSSRPTSRLVITVVATLSVILGCLAFPPATSLATTEDARATVEATESGAIVAPEDPAVANTTSASPSATISALAPFTCAANAPGILFQGAPTTAYGVELVTGENEVFADQFYAQNINAIGYNVFDDYLYGFTTSAPYEVVRVGSDGSVETLGRPVGMPSNTTQYVVGDIDENGHYWVASPVTGAWHQIDLVPGSATYMQQLSSGTISPWPAHPDWSYVPGDNALYSVGTVAGESVLLRFGRTSHTFTNLGSLGVGDAINSGAMYADADGFLYTSNNADGQIYRIDVQNVTATPFADGPASAANDGARCFLSPILLDFGDAPDSYGTTLAADGPRHGIPGHDETGNTAPLMLGSAIDAESDGFPSAAADGDDLDGTDDEDGVAGPIVLSAGQPTTVTVSATNDTDAPATLAGWIDLNGNGTFDPAERVLVTVPANSGTANYDLVFPAGTTANNTYARFRLFPGAITNPLPTGPASAGEVEDHRVTRPVSSLPPFECTTQGLLFQHTAPIYPPTSGTGIDMITGGSSSLFPNITNRAINAVGYNVLDDYVYGLDLSVNPRLVVRVGSDGTTESVGAPGGSTVPGGLAGDVDDQGQYWIGAGGNGWYQVDLAPGSPTYNQVVDEGTITPWPVGADWAFVPGTNALYSVGFVDGVNHLFSFDRDTHVFTDLGDLGVGNAISSGAMYAAPGQLYTSNNGNGQIHRIDVAAVSAELFTTGPGSSGNDGARCPIPIYLDFADAPDSYGTTLAADGARHGIPDYDVVGNSAPLMLGSAIDTESDGFPSAAADGDDLDGTDDEDGVAGPIVLSAGQPTTVTVRATNNTDEAATLAGWIDLNGNGTFDPAERILVTVPANSGTANYDLVFPAGTTVNDTYARFRLFPGAVTDPIPTGPASAGEVEDHPVLVNALHVEKSSDPIDGATVQPGDVVTYTVRVRNDGTAPVTDTITDDLAGVLDDASYNDDVDTTIGTATVTGSQLTWTGTLQPGEEAVITYSVTVFPGTGAEVETIRVLDTVNRPNADGWQVTSYVTDPGCPTLNGPGGAVPYPAQWGLVYPWFGAALGARADQNMAGPGCYPTWPGYDAAPNSWVLTKTFESPEDGLATILTTGFRGDGGARVRVNGIDAGVYGQWNQPAVDGTAQIPVTVGTNTIEIEVHDINGVNAVQGQLDVQIVQIGDNVLENVVTGGDCPTPAVTDPADPTFDPDCHNVVYVERIEISKAVTSGPTSLGDDRYEIGYTVTVTNTGAADGTYDLTDELGYGAGLTVDAATVTNSSPGGIAVNPNWNGVADTTVAADVPIEGANGMTPTVHTYDITVVVVVPPTTTTAAADCEVGPGELGSGAFNTATIVTAGGPQEADACVDVPTTEFDKTLTDIAANGDGSYTLTYELTVSRTGTGGIYDLRDELRLSDALSATSVTAANTAPGTLTTNPGFDGVGDPLVAGAIAIGHAEEHVYEVVVVATVDPTAVTFENSNCALESGEDGTGAMNQAALTIDGSERTADECVEFPATTVDKQITGGPTAIGDGQYELTYTLTVTNQGAGDDVYDLTDELTYGDGVTVVSAGIVNSDPGTITTDPAWNGLDATTVVADQPIAGATAAGPAVHVYTVTVVFTAPATITDEAADCALAGGEDGTGLRNETTVTGRSGPVSDEDCAEVPHTDFAKELASIVANGDDTYTLTYELTVGQSGADTTYDLTDELLLNPATTIESVAATNVTPGDVTLNPDFDGTTDILVAGEVAIADGDTHTYEVAVVVTVDLGEVTFENSNCELVPGESGTGAMNQATFTANGEDIAAITCEPFPATTVDKEIVDGPTAIGDGAYEIVYTITATNFGAGDDTYTLLDELTYGEGIAVVSADVVNSAPGGIVTDPSWDGLDDTTIVADQPIDGATAAGPTVHTYTVTVVVTAPIDLTNEAADCSLGAGEDGTGLLNTVTLSGESGTSTDDECAPLTTTRIVKTVDAVIGNGDGTYTLTYLLSVSRTGDGPAYDLTDELLFGGAVTVESVAVANTTPGDLTTNADFDGVDDTVVATDVAIDDGDTHIYEVTVVASVDAAAVTFAGTDCELTTDESGTGFLNSASVTVNDSTTSDDECVPPPAEPLVDKTVTDGPTPIGDGRYEIVYTITATNPGAGIGMYDVDDALHYGEGMTVVSAEVVNTAPGDLTVNPDWNGTDDIDVVTGQPIEAASDEGPAVHTYTVTVVTEVPLDLPAEVADCQVGTDGSGSGFLNEATLTVNGEADEAEACEPTPTTSFDKELVETVANGDGTYALTYELTVTRTGDGPAYTLTDALRYGAAVTVDAVTATNTAPGGLVTNPDFDGLADRVVAADVAIADGEIHVYTVTVDATVDGDAVTLENSDCVLGSGESGTGFSNTASVRSNDSTLTDTACEPVSAVLVDKAVTEGPTPLGDGSFEVVYTITATNHGAGDGAYTLTDELRFGDGIAVTSAEVVSTEPGGIVVDPAWDGEGVTTVVTDQPIAAATVDGPTAHVYEVTVVVDVPGDLTPAAGDCALTGDESGTGLRNDAATTGDSGPSTDTDCVEPPVNDFTKRLIDIVSLGDHQFELVYELTATRVSGGDGTYTLNDHLMPGESLTIDGVTATNTAPGDAVINEGFDGLADTVVAEDVAFTNGDVHRYEVAVVVTVDVEAVTPGNSDCALTPGEDGTGAMNQASLDADGVVDEVETCEEFPNITVMKRVADGPTALGDGTYGISYLITVMNSGAGEGVYDLDDELHYGEGMTVISTDVADESPGTLPVAVNAGWNGSDDAVIVADQPIDGATADAVVHTYRVDVVVEVAPGTTMDAADCVVDPGEDGSGLLNRAIMTVGADVDEAEACEVPPITVPDKELVEVVGNGDGTTTLVYDVTVTRSGDGPGYDLSDELAYGDAVTVESVSVENTAPGGIATNPDFDGIEDTTIVTDEPIADGEEHVYRVTVVASVDESAVTFESSACRPAGDTGGAGFSNTAAVTSNDITNTDDACEPFAGIVVDKEVTTGPTDLGDDRYEVVYTVTATNNGAGDGVYDLDDQFAFGEGVAIVSAEAANTAPGDLAIESTWNGQDEPRLVTGQPIAGATADGPAVHTYTITAVVDVAAGVTPEAGDCDVDSDELGSGFVNEVTMTVNGEETTADACTEVPLRDELHVEKVVDATTVSFGDTLTYRVTVTNTGTADYTVERPAEIVDDLTDVLDDARWVGNATASDGTVAFTAPKLTWSGALAVGETVTLTYSVELNATATGSGALLNTVGVSSDGSSNCPVGTPATECRTLTRLQLPVPPVAPRSPVTPAPIPVTG